MRTITFVIHVFLQDMIFFHNQILTGGPFPKCETYTGFPFSPFCPGFPFKEKKSFKCDPLTDIQHFYGD